MRIGELSRRTGISTSRIRFYEKHNVLPKPTRNGNGYRTYHYFGRFIRGVFGGFACNGDIDRAAREREWRARRGGSRAMSAWAALGGFFFPPLASARRRLCR